jgi:diaminopropionate ammonia-lyase
VLVPVGVGSLATAIVRHFKAPARSRPSRVIGVEPEDSACVLESLRHGCVHALPGVRRTMMAGLACGTMASAAWPALRVGLDAVVTLSDDRAAAAMRALARRDVVAGESGAAGLAGLLELAEGLDAGGAPWIGPGSRVLTFCTEGATDPVNYRAIVAPHGPRTS